MKSPEHLKLDELPRSFEMWPQIFIRTRASKREKWSWWEFHGSVKSYADATDAAVRWAIQAGGPHLAEAVVVTWKEPPGAGMDDYSAILHSAIREVEALGFFGLHVELPSMPVESSWWRVRTNRSNPPGPGSWIEARGRVLESALIRLVSKCKWDRSKRKARAK